MEQQRGKGYSKGVEAMRVLLVREFAALGESSFTGKEIAALIKQAPGPAREPDVEERGEEELDPVAAAAGAIPPGGIVS